MASVYVPAHYRRAPAGAASQDEEASMTSPAEPGPPPDGTPAQPGQRGTGLTAKLGPMPVWAWILVMAAAATGVMAWMHSRSTARQQSAQATAQPPSSSATGTTSEDGCTDASGNAVPCDQADYAGQIAALQAEIDNLEGPAAAPSQSADASASPGLDSAQLASLVQQNGTAQYLPPAAQNTTLPGS